MIFNQLCYVVSLQVLLVHKEFLRRKRPLYARRQAAISKVPDFWLKVASVNRKPKTL